MQRLLLFFILFFLTLLPRSVHAATLVTISFTQTITPLSTKEYKELKKLFDSAKENKSQAHNLTEHSENQHKYHRLIVAYKLKSFNKAYSGFNSRAPNALSLSLPTLKNTHPPG